MNYGAIVVAAGNSSRFKGNVNKLLYPLSNGNLVINQALKLFEEDEDCKQIVIVTNHETIQYLALNRACGKECYCAGGQTRSESVFNGLKAIFTDVVLVHDGARCYLQKEDLENLKKEMQLQQGAILIRNETDTVKRVENGYIVSTVNRDEIKRALTPQAFRTDDLFKAYSKAFKDGFVATDDASIMENYSDIKIKCVESVGHNSKVTTIDDIR